MRAERNLPVKATSSFRGARKASEPGMTPSVLSDRAPHEYDLAFPRHVMPELCFSETLAKRGRRECRVKASPMARLQKKSRRRHHRFSRSSGIPCAMFDGLYVISSGTGLIAPVICATRERHRELSASTGAPGPHDFTVRIGMFVGANESRCNPTRPPHPAPDVRDDARTSLCGARRRTSYTNSEKTKEEFCSDWTGAVHRPAKADENSFSAAGFRTSSGLPGPGYCRTALGVQDSGYQSIK